MNEKAFEIKMPEGVTGVIVHEVVPMDINRELFIKERKDEKEECMRKMINDVFCYLDHRPEDFGTPYQTILYTPPFDKISLDKVHEFATEQGGVVACLPDLAFEWAYRITKGESWESVCNESNGKWLKLIHHYSLVMLFDGARWMRSTSTCFFAYDEYFQIKFENVSPVIVRKLK